MKVFENIINQWKHDFHNNPSIFWIEIIAVPLEIAASIIMATMNRDAPFALVFCIWLSGAVMLSYTAYKRGAAFVMVLMSFYAFMNVIGLLNLFLK